MAAGDLGARPRPSPAAVMQAFGLGTEVLSMRVITGAWSNRMFRLTTDTGDYAVKQLLDPFGDPRWRDWLDEAWRFEQIAYAAGVPMPQPVANPRNGSWLAWVEPALPSRRTSTGRREPPDSELRVPVRVHRWAFGRRPAPGPAPSAVARWAGRTLATLHGLRVRPLDPTLFPVQDTHIAERWPELVDTADRLGASWARAMAAASDTVAAMAALARTTPPATDAVMSHADLEPKNVVIVGSGPVLCDWDIASPQVPMRELADVALSMGDWSRYDLARSVVSAYEVESGADVRIEPSDLGPRLMANLDWIAFNAERALGLRPASAQQVALGNHLVPGLVARLPARLTTAERVTELLDV